jgi:hypothetical protein
MSQHRFRDAIDVGMRAMRAHPKDAWNYGVIGDAHLELGEYDQALMRSTRWLGCVPTPRRMRASPTRTSCRDVSMRRLSACAWRRKRLVPRIPIARMALRADREHAAAEAGR